MKSVIVCCYFAASLLAHGWQMTGDQLLDKVISAPGAYGQVCGALTVSRDVPLRVYQITDFAGSGFSKSNKALILKNRVPLLSAVRTRLAAIDFSRKPNPFPADPKPEENNDGDAYGCDPASLNPLLLHLIIEMKAVEALPELLVLEQNLVDRIAKARSEVNAPVPWIAGWDVEFSTDRESSEQQREREIRLINVRTAQRDLLLVIQLLMRQKTYGPALKNQVEIAYMQALKADSKKNGWSKYSGELPPELKAQHIERDPVTQIPRTRYSMASVPYSSEIRREIRDAAAQWIKEHPSL